MTGSAASAGVASGAAAGAAASSAAAAATAAAAGTVATQVAVAVAATAAVATATSTAVAMRSPVNVTTACEPLDPVLREGTFTIFFDGFPRELTERESRLVEEIVVEAYNGVTYVEEQGGCIDGFFRDMQNSTLFYQNFLEYETKNVRTDPHIHVLFDHSPIYRS